MSAAPSLTQGDAAQASSPSQKTTNTTASPVVDTAVLTTDVPDHDVPNAPEGELQHVNLTHIAENAAIDGNVIQQPRNAQSIAPFVVVQEKEEQANSTISTDCDVIVPSA